MTELLNIVNLNPPPFTLTLYKLLPSDGYYHGIYGDFSIPHLPILISTENIILIIAPLDVEPDIVSAINNIAL